MTVYRKKIVTPGVYNVNILGKGRETRAITSDKIRITADTCNKMLEAGLKIPAPFAHRDENGVVPKPLAEGEKGSWNAAINGGYWKKFEVDPEDGGLVGFVECPGDENDLNTPAGKVGKTIQETSVVMLPKWEDGEGRIWEDVLWHVALVDGKSVETDQTNFEKVDVGPELALAMAFSMADSVEQPGNQSATGVSHTSEVNKIRELLVEKLDIELPQDTNDMNFYDRFLTVLTSLKTKEEEEDLTKQPEGTESPSSPIAMSELTPEQVEVLEGKLEVIEMKSKVVLGIVLVNKKQELSSRIDMLQKTGKIGKTRAKDWGEKVEAIAMSLDMFDDKGDYPELAIEMAVSAMEEDGISLIDGKASENPPGSSEGVDDPEELGKGEEESMDQETEEAYFKNIGMSGKPILTPAF